MTYEDAKHLEGKSVEWTWRKGIAPLDAGGVGYVMHVDNSTVKLALTGLHPVRKGFSETRSFPLDEIEMVLHH